MTTFLAYWGRSFALLLVSATLFIGALTMANMTADHGTRNMPLHTGRVQNLHCHIVSNGEIPGHVLVKENGVMRLAGPGMVAKTLGKDSPKNITVYNYCR